MQQWVAQIGVAFALLSLLAGFGFVRRGWRGGRVGVHPHCAKCGFDLFGSVGRPRCPECGAELFAVAARVTGARRVNRGALACGAALAVGGAASLAVVGPAAVAGVDWRPYQPAFALRRQLSSADGPTATAAARELLRRLEAGTLSPGQTASAVDAVLARQARPAAPWDHAFGNLVEVARGRGACPDLLWQQYARQAPQVTLEARANLRRGDRLPYGLWMQPARLGSGRRRPPDPDGWLYMSHRLVGIGVKGGTIHPASDEFVRVHGRAAISWSKSWLGENRSVPLPDDVPVGPGTLTLEFKLGVGWFDERDRESPPRVAWRQQFDVAVDVVPAGRETVKRVDAPGLANAVAGSLSIIETHRDHRHAPHRAIVAGGGGSYAGLAFRADRPPANLAFDVFLRDAGGREVPAGGVTFAAGKGRAAGAGVGEAALWELRGATVDVVLRSSGDRARDTVNLSEIWAGSLIFRNVPIVWLRAPERQPAAGWPPAPANGPGDGPTTTTTTGQDVPDYARPRLLRSDPATTSPADSEVK